MRKINDIRPSWAFTTVVSVSKVVALQSLIIVLQNIEWSPRSVYYILWSDVNRLDHDT